MADRNEKAYTHYSPRANREANKDPREIRGREGEVNVGMSDKPRPEDKSPWQHYGKD